MPRITFPADVLDRMEALLQAQLQALQQLRSMQTVHEDSTPFRRQRRKPNNQLTHVDLAYQVLVSAGKPLHIYEIVRQIQDHFGVLVKWQSVLSTIGRQAAKGQRFIRTGKNTFGLLGSDES